MTVLPATLDLKVAPHQDLHFGAAAHKADEHGLILGVPYDTAMVLIRDKDHPAVEATAEDLARAGYVSPSDTALNAGPLAEITAEELADLRFAAARADSIFTSLAAKFGGAEIVDTGETRAPLDDMIFIVVKDGVEITSGTVTELFEHVDPAPVTDTVAPQEATETAPEADTDEGDVTDETAQADGE